MIRLCFLEEGMASGQTLCQTKKTNKQTTQTFLKLLIKTKIIFRKNNTTRILQYYKVQRGLQALCTQMLGGF